ncbi:glucose-6-phosphate dehydrogenase [Hyphomonas atlantica]|uniref:glucose-6-phosphate dehydrogenase n=1 Tax=Hyphomonas atlantica TaxID=1280948 RepID=UPI003517B3AD
MAKFIPVDAFDIVIFGGTGDLSQRKLLPALYHRYLDGQIPDDSRLVGVSRSEMTDKAFREFALKACKASAGKDFKLDDWKGFEKMLSYVGMDATDPGADWAALANALSTEDRPTIFYLAVTPKIYVPICEAIGKAGLAKGDARVVLEKPIGTDLESAREINAGVGAVFPEDRIYRIDHYLGKETVQNLLVLRFGNTLFEPLWNRTAIDHIQITVSESVGVGDRAGYYDSAGAVRDMVQNHILQLLALVAMEPPTSFDATAVRDEKVKVLRALRPIQPNETVTGQYRAGAINGEAVPGYDEELGRDSETETFVALKAHIDNWRWKGVPFYMRTGKRLPERTTEIIVKFRDVPFSIFEDRGAKTLPNTLVIGIQPRENIRLSLMAKVPGLDRGGIRLRQVPLDIAMPDAFAGPERRIAYERLLLDLVEGDQTLFVRRDEVEAQWNWIDGIRETWDEANITPKTYTAGSWGPSAAIALAERDGVTWHE